jgi:hypothetical protein
MTRKDVSTGTNAATKTAQKSGLGTKRTTKISAKPTKRRIDIILNDHFRFWRFICKVFLGAYHVPKLSGIVPRLGNQLGFKMNSRRKAGRLHNFAPSVRLFQGHGSTRTKRDWVVAAMIAMTLFLPSSIE